MSRIPQRGEVIGLEAPKKQKFIDHRVGSHEITADKLEKRIWAMAAERSCSAFELANTIGVNRDRVQKTLDALVRCGELTRIDCPSGKHRYIRGGMGWVQLSRLPVPSMLANQQIPGHTRRSK